MADYYLTVFNQSGEQLLNETIQAASDEEAKRIGEQKLAEANYSAHPHRLTRAGKLLLFHR
ncbi:YhzD family protein [Alkalihalobacillus sp. BA299]|uniref:YhzD family protein n=1 Tax=Alkalihalobacillus sp. BA299 TaxID=2815938 RepID=UPI001ADB3F33|nr:YhzD family protein [Alkalihalobacillus sp. BA299]